MIEGLQDNEKELLIESLTEKLQTLTGQRVILSELTAYSSSAQLNEEIKNILKLTNIRLVTHLLDEGVFISGELDFNECVDLTNKLMGTGLIKTGPVVLSENTYIGFKTSDNKYSVLLPKPNK